jgi:transcriptional regulator with XRE-family HTH domain
MHTEGDLRRLIARLRLTLRRTGGVQREVSARLGYHPNYLGQVLRGRARLSVRLVLSVLAEAGVAPERFFAELYGFTDLLPPAPAAPEPGAAQRLRAEVEAEVRRLADALWLKISEAGLSQREVSRRLDVHRDYVNQVLRGNLELKVDHVLSILEVLAVPPEEFFAEHYGVNRRFARQHDPQERLPGDVSWGELLSFFDAAVTELRTALRKQGRGGGKPRRTGDHRQPAGRRPRSHP